MEAQSSKHKSYVTPLLAGAVAGISVDVALYPLDTLKTRLQSAQGFQRAGGFRGVYRGLSAVAVSSMPTTALFFGAYEASKRLLLPRAPPPAAPLAHMLCACAAETLACVIRVPAEVAKQRRQTGGRRGAAAILVDAYRAEGLRRGVYRGFASTVARDLPFVLLEMPLWELLKAWLRPPGGDVTSLQSALCGSLAGGAAGAVTTPLDLAKTRIMLAGAPGAAGTSGAGAAGAGAMRVGAVLAREYARGGVRALYAGAAPRVAAFFFGGFVFFGAYDEAKALLERRLELS